MHPFARRNGDSRPASQWPRFLRATARLRRLPRLSDGPLPAAPSPMTRAPVPSAGTPKQFPKHHGRHFRLADLAGQVV
jgi:hypothetical protein